MKPQIKNTTFKLTAESVKEFSEIVSEKNVLNVINQVVIRHETAVNQILISALFKIDETGSFLQNMKDIEMSAFYPNTDTIINNIIYKGEEIGSIVSLMAGNTMYLDFKPAEKYKHLFKQDTTK